MTRYRPRAHGLPPVAAWLTGALVAGAALLGMVSLVAFIALFLAPPAWVQVLLGVVVTAGGALFGWLVATALKSGS